MSNKCRKHKKHKPVSAMKQNHFIGRLFGKCRIEIEAPQEAQAFVDLEISMWSILERAANNQLSDIDTNDMGAYGNLCTLVASECEDKAMYELAQQWNDKVQAMRLRFLKWNKWEFSKEEHALVVECLETLNPWLMAQPKARLARAWTLALAVRDDMLAQGKTVWLVDDPVSEVKPPIWAEDRNEFPQKGLGK